MGDESAVAPGLLPSLTHFIHQTSARLLFWLDPLRNAGVGCFSDVFSPPFLR